MWHECERLLILLLVRSHQIGSCWKDESVVVNLVKVSDSEAVLLTADRINDASDEEEQS
jgi:hypothetical protein